MDSDAAAGGSAPDRNATLPEAPRPLTVADLDRAGRTIARAFAWHEPWGAWAFPDESTREQMLFGLAADDLRARFLEHGECWTIAGACVTLWIPPGVAAFDSRRSEEELAIYGEMAEAMRAGDQLISSMKPDVEHWYLDTIATDPRRMRRGLAGRLLDHDLEVRDARGDACALDTHTGRNIEFYARRGFEVIAEGELPGGPDVAMMFRPART